MSLDELPLGKATDYPKSFSRDLLSRIPRSDSRAKLLETNPDIQFSGYDLWTLYELMWVSIDGAPNAVIGEIRVPATSEFIVESKSLKLYANSLYYRRFENADQVRDEIAHALTTLLESQVIVHLWPLADFGMISKAGEFINLDQRGVPVSSGADASLLSGESVQGFSKCYKTDCFRSLCPVTGQPDWASVYVGIQSVKIDDAELAKYLLSYSEHQGFHESCIEQIYSDLQQRLEPDQLTVAARFTRRGGIDISPYRTSAKPVFEMPQRTVRQ